MSIMTGISTSEEAPVSQAQGETAPKAAFQEVGFQPERPVSIARRPIANPVSNPGIGGIDFVA
jgi:hypothetical protein